MLTNKKEKALVTRQTILDAAEEVFFETGFSGATLEKIAHRSQVTRGAIYWHFANKTEVLEAVIDRAGSFYEEALGKITREASSLEEFEDFSIKLLQGIARDKKKQRALGIILLRHEHLASETSIVAREGESHERTVKILTHFFLRIHSDHGAKLSAHEAQLQAQALLFYAHGILSKFFMYPEKIPLAKDAKRYMQLFFNAIRLPPSNP
jgi:TetR/AcrR family acrAB operon transcriptional repressor